MSRKFGWNYYKEYMNLKSGEIVGWTEMRIDRHCRGLQCCRKSWLLRNAKVQRYEFMSCSYHNNLVSSLSPVHTSNNRLCRKNRSICSIRQCGFDFVAGVSGFFLVVRFFHVIASWSLAAAVVKRRDVIVRGSIHQLDVDSRAAAAPPHAITVTSARPAINPSKLC